MNVKFTIPAALHRPDFSKYVVHFTSSRPPRASVPGVQGLQEITQMSAYERLVAILEGSRIMATPMPWTGALAVAFTECPWGSLIHHAQQYSPYGLGFEKGRLFAAGGGPAIYLRPDLYERQAQYARVGHGESATPFHPNVWPFVTPFVPMYAPKKLVETHWKGKKIVDYTHEREWRVPHDFSFKLSQVAFVVVNTYEDVAKFPAEFKDAIGRDCFLIMDVYEQIERFWPTHVSHA